MIRTLQEWRVACTLTLRYTCFPSPTLLHSYRACGALANLAVNDAVAKQIKTCVASAPASTPGSAPASALVDSPSSDSTSTSASASPSAAATRSMAAAADATAEAAPEEVEDPSRTDEMEAGVGATRDQREDQSSSGGGGGGGGGGRTIHLIDLIEEAESHGVPGARSALNNMRHRCTIQ